MCFDDGYPCTEARAYAAQAPAQTAPAQAAAAACAPADPLGVPFCLFLKPSGVKHYNEITSVLARINISIGTHKHYPPSAGPNYELRSKLRKHFATMAESAEKERMLDSYVKGGFIVARGLYLGDASTAFDKLAMHSGMISGMIFAFNGVAASTADYPAVMSTSAADAARELAVWF